VEISSKDCVFCKFFYLGGCGAKRTAFLLQRTQTKTKTKTKTPPQNQFFNLISFSPGLFILPVARTLE